MLNVYAWLYPLIFVIMVIMAIFMKCFRFYPLGLVMPYILQEKIKYEITCTICIGALLSLSIELFQYVSGAGIGEVTDILMNTAGASLGSIVFRIRIYRKFKN